MKKKKLLIVGGQGSGEIAMSTFKASNEKKLEWDICGYINDVVNPGEEFCGEKVLGGTESIIDWIDKGYYIHYTLHYNAKKKEERVKLFEDLKIPKEAFASAAHPLSYINQDSVLGINTLLLPFSATSVGSVLGNHCHIYTSAFLGHDCKIGDFTTIAAHSIIGGRVKVLDGAHVGLNSTLREDIEIGEYSIIGMGSVVVKNVEKKTVVAGNPARFIKNLE
ncbi:MAG: hypothetical protein JJ971_07385 [Balneolaceae bacterium]|nr:hypothetical protein [Balneolaceae bacterium]MBO6546944.1 hypothetical protein [Balneolaceae bacterium]MBO6649304.1 hypothetical protein [Balneolaceae bacterium]